MATVSRIPINIPSNQTNDAIQAAAEGRFNSDPIKADLNKHNLVPTDLRDLRHWFAW